MEIYKEIRRMRLDGMSQRRIAKVLHISRNTVKKYWDGDSVPWVRKDYSRKATVITDEVIAFVRKCLEEDADAIPRNSTTLLNGSTTVWLRNVALLAAKQPSDGW